MAAELFVFSRAQVVPCYSKYDGYSKERLRPSGMFWSDNALIWGQRRGVQGLPTYCRSVPPFRCTVQYIPRLGSQST